MGSTGAEKPSKRGHKSRHSQPVPHTNKLVPHHSHSGRLEGMSRRIGGTTPRHEDAGIDTDQDDYTDAEPKHRGAVNGRLSMLADGRDSYPMHSRVRNVPKKVLLSTGKAIIRRKVDCWLTFEEYDRLTRYVYDTKNSLNYRQWMQNIFTMYLVAWFYWHKFLPPPKKKKRKKRKPCAFCLQCWLSWLNLIHSQS